MNTELKDDIVMSAICWADALDDVHVHEHKLRSMNACSLDERMRALTTLSRARYELANAKETLLAAVAEYEKGEL